MTQKRLPIKDILAAVDMGAKSVWDELDNEECKQVSFWLLNRYVSSVNGNREDQELAIFKTNEYYNKDYMVVSKHQKLMWQLLCQAGNTGKIQFHQWIGFKKKSSKTNDDGVKLLSRIYPNMKLDEMENLVSISTTKELKELAEEHGIESKK